MNAAVVVAFVYNRPHHAMRMLRALAANTLASQTNLLVFSDGPRNDSDAAKVEETRDVVRGTSGFRSVTLIQRPTNLGLARSITQGIGEVTRAHESFIVVEDDLITSPYFLSYMNEGLSRFAGVPEVGSIHGYVYPVAALPDYFFLRGADCWGWATWSECWRLLNPDPLALLRGLEASGRITEFDDGGGGLYLNLLVGRALGRNQSWAILWHASLYLAGRLTLYPGRSFVNNIGHEGSGTHAKPSAAYEVSVRSDYDGIDVAGVQHNHAASEKISSYLRSTTDRTWIRQIAERLHARLVLRWLTSAP